MKTVTVEYDITMTLCFTGQTKMSIRYYKDMKERLANSNSDGAEEIAEYIDWPRQIDSADLDCECDQFALVEP